MSTHSEIYIQIIFAVNGSDSLIGSHWENELYKFITGIVQAKGNKMLAIDGMPDHIHFFIGLHIDCTLADLVREIKKSSNAYINSNKFTKSRFSWQSGYGAFSYSKSDIDTVVKYIMNQKEHHKNQTFKDEFISFLKEYNIKYDEKYLFNWIDYK